MEHHDGLVDSACPACDYLSAPMLAIVSFPTLQEAEQKLAKPTDEEKQPVRDCSRKPRDRKPISGKLLGTLISPTGQPLTGTAPEGAWRTRQNRPGTTGRDATFARRFGFYDDWQSTTLRCPSCDWSGSFPQGMLEYHDESIESSCPACDALLCIVSMPTIEEMEQYRETPKRQARDEERRRSVALVSCFECGHAALKGARACPHCRTPLMTKKTATPKMTRLAVHALDDDGWGALHRSPEVRAIAFYSGPSWFDLTEAERRAVRTRAAQAPVSEESCWDYALGIKSHGRPKVWTMRVLWPDGSTEQLHVEATNEWHARVRAADILGGGEYRPDWDVTEVIGPRLRRYTLLARWPDGGLRELDVDAPHEWAAWREGAAQLARDYEPGGEIIQWRAPRRGLYLESPGLLDSLDAGAGPGKHKARHHTS